MGRPVAAPLRPRPTVVSQEVLESGGVFVGRFKSKLGTKHLLATEQQHNGEGAMSCHSRHVSLRTGHVPILRASVRINVCVSFIPRQRIPGA